MVLPEAENHLPPGEDRWQDPVARGGLGRQEPAGDAIRDAAHDEVAGYAGRLKEMEAEREGLEARREGLEARRERLELTAIDREMLTSIVDNFENVMAEGPNPKKKHLLHLLVKKVLIHSRKTVEIWYVLPNSQRFANCNIWLPKCNSMRTRPGWVEPEIYFRVTHIAQDAQSGAPVAAYRDQTVEIALGPKGGCVRKRQHRRPDARSADRQGCACGPSSPEQHQAAQEMINTADGCFE